MKAGVVLSGCGVFDGAEIREAVLVLLALDRSDVQFEIFAPDVDQLHVIDHRLGAPALGERRNVLTEAARIARGKIRPLSEARAIEADAWLWPGGFGAAKNLCKFAVEGASCGVEPETARLIAEAHQAGVAQCFCCIAPALAARALQLAGVTNVKLTIGCDASTADALRAMGQQHVEQPVEGFVVDATHRIVSTPAYMYDDARLSAVEAGISGAVAATLRLARR